MMQKTLFKEEQKFTNPVLWVFIALVFTMALAPETITLVKHLYFEKPVDVETNRITSLVILIVLLIIMFIGVVILFKKIKLVLEVKTDGLYYSYPPFIRKSQSILKKEIDNILVRKYKPIREFSGWGIKYGWAGAGRAYTIRGNVGLQVYLKNGKKVLFGTQRGDALLRAAKKMMKEG
jgi:hypothetical protein